MLLFRCYERDNNKTLSNLSTPSSEIDSPFPSQYQLHQSQSNDSSNQLSSSECLLRSIPRPSHILVRSTTTLPRQRRDRFRPGVESDAARYLSQFASQLPHISSRTRRCPVASRSATSISTMATASTMTSMTTSSAPSLIHTPESSLDVSAPASPTRRSSFFLYHDPSTYSYNTALAATATRSVNLLTPILLPSDQESTPACVPTIKVEAEKQSSTCCPIEESKYKVKTTFDYIPTAAVSSVPAQLSTTKRSLSPLGIHLREDFAYDKQATSLNQGCVRGNLKQLLDAGTAQMST